MKINLPTVLGITLIANTTFICSESSAALFLGEGKTNSQVGGSFLYYPDPQDGNSYTEHSYHDDAIHIFNLSNGSFNEEIAYAEATSSDGLSKLASRAAVNLSVNQADRTTKFQGGGKASVLLLEDDTDHYLGRIFPDQRFSTSGFTYDFTLDTAHTFIFGESQVRDDGIGNQLVLELLALSSDPISISCTECYNQSGILDPGNYRISFFAQYSTYPNELFPGESSISNNFSLSLTDIGDNDNLPLPAPTSLFLMLSALIGLPLFRKE